MLVRISCKETVDLGGVKGDKARDQFRDRSQITFEFAVAGLLTAPPILFPKRNFCLDGDVDRGE